MPSPESLHNSTLQEGRTGSSTNINELLLTCAATTAGIISTCTNLEHGHMVGAAIVGTIGALSGRHLYHLLKGSNTKKQAVQNV